jgi:hypothetical protein
MLAYKLEGWLWQVILLLSLIMYEMTHAHLHPHTRASTDFASALFLSFGIGFFFKFNREFEEAESGGWVNI